MEYDGESGESVSSMSEIEDIEEVFELELSPDGAIDEKKECVKKCESLIRSTPDKGYSLRTVKWSPKIENVCHIAHDDSKKTEIKSETDHLVLVKEDKIKQEELLLNENDEHTSYCNDLQKSIFAEYPNLKIKDEFNFTSCSIKLEKIDLSHLSSYTTSDSLRPSENSSSSPVSSRVQNQGARKRGQSRRRGSREKNNATRSERATRSNTSIGGRCSSRLKQTASDKEITETTARKVKKSSGEYKSRKRSISTKTRSSAVLSDKSKTDLSQGPKSKKVRFMEAHGLTDRQESTSKSKDLNSSTKKKKTVSFADDKGLDIVIQEKEKDPIQDYKRAIANYSSEIDLYKRELNSWFECLCCDHKFHLLEHCQVHVRQHFPGMLTN